MCACVVSTVENAEDFHISHEVMKSLELYLLETFSSSNASLCFDGHLYHLERWAEEMKEKSKGKFAKTFSMRLSVRKDNCKPSGYFRLMPLYSLCDKHIEQQAHVKVVETNIAMDYMCRLSQYSSLVRHLKG